jgi:hypothetical protein
MASNPDDSFLSEGYSFLGGSGFEWVMV